MRLNTCEGHSISSKTIVTPADISKLVKNNLIPPRTSIIPKRQAEVAVRTSLIPKRSAAVPKRTVITPIKRMPIQTKSAKIVISI